MTLVRAGHRHRYPDPIVTSSPTLLALIFNSGVRKGIGARVDGATGIRLSTTYFGITRASKIRIDLTAV